MWIFTIETIIKILGIIVLIPLFIGDKYVIGAQDFYSSNMGSFSGEVNLESLKARNLLPKKCNYFKVLARGTLDKKLTFEANDFSKDAIKMILVTGGKVVKIEE